MVMSMMAMAAPATLKPLKLKTIYRHRGVTVGLDVIGWVWENSSIQGFPNQHDTFIPESMQRDLVSMDLLESIIEG